MRAFLTCFHRIFAVQEMGGNKGGKYAYLENFFGSFAKMLEQHNEWNEQALKLQNLIPENWEDKWE